MVNLRQNPNTELLEQLKVSPVESSPIPVQRSLELFSSAEDDLEFRYCRHHPFGGKGASQYVTIQVIEDEEYAENQFTTLRDLETGYFLHPQGCEPVQTTLGVQYYMKFDTYVRGFNAWIEHHKAGKVSDDDMWELLKAIGAKLAHTSGQRSHGNLGKGICVRVEATKFDVVFYNVGAPNDYIKDVVALEGILSEIGPQLQDPEIQDEVSRWMDWLWTILATYSSGTSRSSTVRSLTDEDVMFIFNYPAAWDAERCINFVWNLNTLCSTKLHCKDSDLSHCKHFRKYLCDQQYDSWNTRLTSHILNEVFDFGYKQGSYSFYDFSGRAYKFSVPSIVMFAHNTIKHLREKVQYQNNEIMALNKAIRKMAKAANSASPPVAPLVADPTPSKVLELLRHDFRYLIEDLYRAFHYAVSQGYRPHHYYTIAQILTGRI